MQAIQSYQLPAELRALEEAKDAAWKARNEHVIRHNSSRKGSPGWTRETYEEYERLNTDALEAARRHSALMQRELPVMLEAISVPQGLRGAAADVVTGAVSKTVTKQVAEASEMVARLINRDILPQVKVTVTRGKRAGYDRFERAIHVNSRMDLSAFVHEIVHDIEYRFPEVSARSKAFLLRRADGGPLERLRDMTGSRSYGTNEVAYRDRFEELGGTHYMGKWYDRPSTEVLTMGIERLMANPRTFYDQDPDYFQFIIETLHKAF